MSFETCMSIIENFSVEKQRNAILAFIKDETQPFEQRFKVWRKTPDALQVGKSWGWSHPDFDDDEWYKYDWWNRGERIDLRCISDYKDWDDEKFRKFHEGCMKEGIWWFKFDW